MIYKKFEKYKKNVDYRLYNIDCRLLNLTYATLYKESVDKGCFIIDLVKGLTNKASLAINEV